MPYIYIYRKSPGQWVTVAPWKESDPNGPKQESQIAYPYQRALHLNAGNIACCALFQWADSRGYDRESISSGYSAIMDYSLGFEPGFNSRRLLKIGIDAAKRIEFFEEN